MMSRLNKLAYLLLLWETSTNISLNWYVLSILQSWSHRWIGLCRQLKCAFKLQKQPIKRVSPSKKRTCGRTGDLLISLNLLWKTKLMTEHLVLSTKKIILSLEDRRNNFKSSRFGKLLSMQQNSAHQAFCLMTRNLQVLLLLWVQMKKSVPFAPS